MSESRKGFLLGLAAYAMWGLFPLYWPLLEPAGAVEILAHRVLWSMVTHGCARARCCVVRRPFRAMVQDRRVVAAARPGAPPLITVNWATYIWGVNNGHVVETSLGYFINPLVTVLMGVFILGERLRPLAVGGARDRRARGRGADPRLRPSALGGAGAGVLVRQLRAVQEDRPARRRSRA